MSATTGDGWPKIRARRRTRLSQWVEIIEREVEFAPGGAPATYHAVAQADYLAIVARTPAGLFPMVRQYRPAVETFTWELPAGLVEANEDLAVGCARELMEETGLPARAVHKLGSAWPCPGRLSNAIHSFFVEAGEQVRPFQPEAGLEVRLVTAAELAELIAEGAFPSQLHLGALLLAEVRGFIALPQSEAPVSDAPISRLDGPPARGNRRTTTWLLILKIALSALAIWYVARTIDLADAWHHAVNQNAWLLLAAAAAMAAQIALGAVRWHIILARLGASPRLKDTFNLYYIGAFFNYCVWGGAVSGDVVRGWLSARSSGNPSAAVNSVILDRIATLASMAILVVVTAPFFISRAGVSLVTILPPCVAAAGLVAFIVTAQLHRIPDIGRLARVTRWLQAFGHATRLLLLHPRTTALVFAFGIATQVAMSLTAYFIARSIGIAITPFDCLVLMQTVALITALPISIGGWGVREVAMIGIFGSLGVAQSATLVLSVQLGVLAVILSLPGAILWLNRSV